uniref:HTH psq-type domain-containing protein n=1 Tax=Peronospora matthiolae TaxID=2874970 RepID=A0AAV1TH58_9STRA
MPRASSNVDAQHRRAKLRPPWSAASGAKLHEFLSEQDEREVLNVLRAQFHHEQRITSDDVRFVVRAVASHDGAGNMPPDFPSTRWILAFKRAHGFASPAASAASRVPEHRLNVGSRSCNVAHVTTTSSDDERDELDGQCASRYDVVRELEAGARLGSRRAATDDRDSQLLQRARRQQQERRSLVVDDHRVGSALQQREQMWDREDLGSNASSGSGDSENGATTGDSSSNSSSASVAPSSTVSRDVTNREDGVASVRDVAAATTTSSSTRHGYKLSHTVPPETWEKAIVAVEQQGMSLRAAAKVYGVHFAALHRRVKKRAQEGQSSKATTGYFHQRDETGIMRVVVARAELGVLMTFDELMKLVEAAALRKLPDISVKHARNLMVRFQSRNEQSIRHLIVDWPPPVSTVSLGSVGSHYHLEHPGFVYGTDSESSYSASMQRAFATCATTGSMAVAVTTVAPLPILSPLPSSCIIGNSSCRPMLPSLNVDVNFLRPLAAQQQQQHLQRQQS